MNDKVTRTGDGGWTLLELMVVVLILGILVSIAVATYRVSVDRAQLVTCQSNQHILNTALAAYEQDHGGQPAPNLAALSPYVKGRSAGFDTCPADPNVHYTYESTSGLITCPLHPAQ